MEGLVSLALQAWRENSSEGVLVIDRDDCVCLVNPRARELLGLVTVPHTVAGLLEQAAATAPELRTLLAASEYPQHTQWGNLHLRRQPPQRVIWQLIPLFHNGAHTASLLIFREATTEVQLDLAKQSFLSMVSHDLRTPLSTILGFAELLYYNRTSLSEAEQTEFIEHIIKNANSLSRYTQIALDILYLEADQRQLDTQTVRLDSFVRQWLTDALHRFRADQFVYAVSNGEAGVRSEISTSAMHRILTILAEFALAETPVDEPITLRLVSHVDHAHVLVEHHAPNLSEDDAAGMFSLMHPRDLTEAGRPSLHRMQLYVASLLASRQHGNLTLRSQVDHRYTFDLAVPLASDEYTSQIP